MLAHFTVTENLIYKDHSKSQEPIILPEKHVPTTQQNRTNEN